jgi:hypothetical protein
MLVGLPGCAIPCQQGMSDKTVLGLCRECRCRRLVTASIAGETAPVTVCFLASGACASTLFPWGPRCVTGLA